MVGHLSRCVMSTASPIPELEPAPVRVGPNIGRRLASVDVFRGLIIAGMILVTNAGSWDFVYWPLKHALWNGVTPTDMIFPSFLFLAGVSMGFSFAARRRRGATDRQLAAHVILRSAGLILLGLLLNGLPFFDLPNLRIPGILQRIGLCYLGAGLFYLAISLRSSSSSRAVVWLVSALAGLMIGYWSLLHFVPVPGYGAGRLDQAGNLGAYIDRSVFGSRHLWFWGGQMWDPEGLLSTMTAACNMLLGILSAFWIGSSRSTKDKLVGMALAGALLLIAGISLNPILPINKKIWSDSFVLFSGGFSLLAQAFLCWAIDEHGARWGVTAATVFGKNAILAFSLATILNALEPLLQFHSGGQTFTIRNAIYDALAHGLSPYNASLGYALFFLAVIGAILWPFYRRGIFLRL
jgi:predicted acyltransferase